MVTPIVLWWKENDGNNSNGVRKNSSLQARNIEEKASPSVVEDDYTKLLTLGLLLIYLGLILWQNVT